MWRNKKPILPIKVYEVSLNYRGEKKLVKIQHILNVRGILIIKIKQNKRIENDRVRGTILSWVVRGKSSDAVLHE